MYDKDKIIYTYIYFMESTPSTLCKNCDTTLTGRYCIECGQSADTERISYHSIIHEIEHGIIHIDKGIFYTIKELVLRPGRTIKGYLAGKRVDHFKPFAFLFITATIYAVLAKVTHSGTLFGNIQVSVQDKDDQVFIEAFEWIKNHYAYALVLLLPLISLSTLIVYRKSAYNYFEHLVINAYTTGIKTCFNIFLIPFYYIFTSKEASSKIGTLKFIAGLAITIYFFYQVFDYPTKGKRLFNALFAIFLSNLLLFILLAAAILIFFTDLE